jgi:hypothetical protein
MGDRDSLMGVELLDTSRAERPAQALVHFRRKRCVLGRPRWESPNGCYPGVRHVYAV